MTGNQIVRFGFLLAGGLFLFAAAKPAIVGDPLDATYLAIGVACVVLAVVVGRRPGGLPPAK